MSFNSNNNTNKNNNWVLRHTVPGTSLCLFNPSNNVMMLVLLLLSPFYRGGKGVTEHRINFQSHMLCGGWTTCWKLLTSVLT